MHGYKALLTDVLKGRMGFGGFVVGDWNGHGQVAGCTTDQLSFGVPTPGWTWRWPPDSWKGLYG